MLKCLELLVGSKITRVVDYDNSSDLIITTKDNHIVVVTLENGHHCYQDTGSVGIKFDSRGCPIKDSYRDLLEVVAYKIYNENIVAFDILSIRDGTTSTVPYGDVIDMYTKERLVNPKVLENHLVFGEILSSIPSVELSSLESLIGDLECVVGKEFERNLHINENAHRNIPNVRKFAEKIVHTNNSIFCVDGTRGSGKSTFLGQLMGELATTGSIAINLPSGKHDMYTLDKLVSTIVNLGYTTIMLDTVSAKMLYNTNFEELENLVTKRGIKLVLFVENLITVKSLIDFKVDLVCYSLDLSSSRVLSTSNYKTYLTKGSVSSRASHTQLERYLSTAVNAYNEALSKDISISDYLTVVIKACRYIILSRLDKLGITHVNYATELSDSEIELLRGTGIICDTCNYFTFFFFRLPWFFNSMLEIVLNQTTYDSSSLSREDLTSMLVIEDLLLVKKMTDDNNCLFSTENDVITFSYESGVKTTYVVPWGNFATPVNKLKDHYIHIKNYSIFDYGNTSNAMLISDLTDLSPSIRVL